MKLIESIKKFPKENPRLFYGVLVSLAINVTLLLWVFLYGDDNLDKGTLLACSILLQLLITLQLFAIQENTHIQEDLKSQKSLIDVMIAHQAKVQDDLNKFDRELKDTTTVAKKLLAQNKRVNEVFGHMFNLNSNRIDAVCMIAENLGQIPDHPLLEDLLSSQLTASFPEEQTNLLGGKYHQEYMVGYTALGGHEMLYEQFRKYFKKFEEGYSYRSVTLLDFWYPDLLSDPIAFIRDNIAASKRGAEIRRIFVLEKRFEELEKLHCNLLERCLKHESDNFQTRVLYLQNGIKNHEKKDYAYSFHPKSPYPVRTQFDFNHDAPVLETERHRFKNFNVMVLKNADEIKSAIDEYDTDFEDGSTCLTIEDYKKIG